MKEDFPLFLWKYQYFSKIHLKTTSNESIVVIHQGIQNHQSGPDFYQATVIIGNIKWHGHIEIHVKSSHWYQHKHQEDPVYDKVVLHVVWEHNQEVYRQDGTVIPTLALKPRVKRGVIDRYELLLQSISPIPCGIHIPEIDKNIIKSMVEIAVDHRLQRKSKMFMAFFSNNYSWEEITYFMLGKNFGFNVNQEPFLRLCQKLPLKLLLRHRGNRIQVEALIFGMAGFLNEKPKDEYHGRLIKEFHFLSHKYQLEDNRLQRHEWKFLRLRPANFPTRRLAQFGALYNEVGNLFSIFKHCASVSELKKQIDFTTSEYWQIHYHFGKQKVSQHHNLGEESFQNIVINTIVPLKIAYGALKGDQNIIDQATEILTGIPMENNKIIRIWRILGLEATNAFDSQGLIEQYQHFCLEKKCLNCSLGVSLLKRV